MKRSLFALVLLLLLGAGGYWLLNSGMSFDGARAVSRDTTATAQAPRKSGAGNRGPLPVEVAVATQTTLSDDVTAIGTLLAEESVDISAETSGRIASILFEDGDTVAAGAALFDLDAALIKAELADAEARRALAQTVFDRNQKLRNSGNMAESAFDASATALELGRSAVELAKVRLDKLVIKAPFGGTLGFRTVSLGAYVAAGAPLVHLDKIDRLKVSFSIAELDFSRLANGQEIGLVADALPGEKFTATVSAIDPAMDVNGRALKVRADLDNAGLKLRPGLLVRITVKGAPRDAVTVPEAAIVPRGTETVVFLTDNNTAREAKVSTGQYARGFVEIVAGVEAGQAVVTAGNTRLSNGAAIEIVQAQDATN
ncbi:MAG: efflux RND transporter periplasmic adaptor subunit [Pseudomonadota bacterium]|nr:efflux RND transporter periplasmic adaptor subunit [Pseudomonadota bacterium]